MSDEYRQRIGIPEDDEFVQIDTWSKQKRGCDTDYYVYEQRTLDGEVVARYEVEDEMVIYPPQNRTIRHRKL